MSEPIASEGKPTPEQKNQAAIKTMFGEWQNDTNQLIKLMDLPKKVDSIDAKYSDILDKIKNKGGNSSYTEGFNAGISANQTKYAENLTKLEARLDQMTNKLSLFENKFEIVAWSSGIKPDPLAAGNRSEVLNEINQHIKSVVGIEDRTPITVNSQPALDAINKAKTDAIHDLNQAKESLADMLIKVTEARTRLEATSSDRLTKLEARQEAAGKLLDQLRSDYETYSNKLAVAANLGRSSPMGTNAIANASFGYQMLTVLPGGAAFALVFVLIFVGIYTKGKLNSVFEQKIENVKKNQATLNEGFSVWGRTAGDKIQAQLNAALLQIPKRIEKEVGQGQSNIKQKFDQELIKLKADLVAEFNTDLSQLKGTAQQEFDDARTSLTQLTGTLAQDLKEAAGELTRLRLEFADEAKARKTAEAQVREQMRLAANAETARKQAEDAKLRLENERKIEQDKAALIAQELEKAKRLADTETDRIKAEQAKEAAKATMAVQAQAELLEKERAEKARIEAEKIKAEEGRRIAEKLVASEKAERELAAKTIEDLEQKALKEAQSRREAEQLLNAKMEEERVAKELVQAQLQEKTTALAEAKRTLDSNSDQKKAENAAFWPPFFLSGSLDSWRNRMEAIKQVDSNAFDLSLALGRFNNACKLPEDKQEVAAALTEVSIKAYRFWKAQKVEVLPAAQEWSQAFQQYLDEQAIPLEIILAIEALPFNADSMLAVGDSSASRMVVKEVISWGIQDKSCNPPRNLYPARVLTA